MTTFKLDTSGVTMKAALKRVAARDAKIVWHLENAARDHRLPGLAYVSREAALADERLSRFPEYRPFPFLQTRAIERRWETGPGRAGGDVRRAHPFFQIKPIREVR